MRREVCFCVHLQYCPSAAIISVNMIQKYFKIYQEISNKGIPKVFILFTISFAHWNRRRKEKSSVVKLVTDHQKLPNRMRKDGVVF